MKWPEPQAILIPRVCHTAKKPQVSTCFEKPEALSWFWLILSPRGVSAGVCSKQDTLILTKWPEQLTGLSEDRTLSTEASSPKIGAWWSPCNRFFPDSILTLSRNASYEKPSPMCNLEYHTHSATSSLLPTWKLTTSPFLTWSKFTTA